MGMGAKSFRDLNVYRFARDSAKQIYLRSKEFPAEERYSLTDQIRRSSRAVKAMTAEAWARRRYKAVFINKLDEALGEANETQSWLDDALDCGHLSSAEHEELDQQYRSISGMLARMMDRAADFCKNVPATDYRSTPTRVQEDEAFFAE
jgi:four helix bundle protein